MPQLVVELALDAPAGEQGAQEVTGTGQGAHRQAIRRTRATAAERRSQLAVSSPRRFWPARVSR